MNRRSPNYCMCSSEIKPEELETLKVDYSESPWSREGIRLQLQLGLQSEASLRPRVGPCPRGLHICCGSCVHICPARCIWDVQSRLHMAYSTSELRETIFKFIPTSIDYLQACSLVNTLTSGYYNTKQEMNPNVDGSTPWPENPNKVDYAPMIELSEGKPVVDPLTGVVKILHWPESGLCRFCLPRVSPYGKPGRPSKR